jgi:hypothetical protein
MLGAGALASLKLGSGRKGQGGIGRPFVVQVNPSSQSDSGY